MSAKPKFSKVIKRDGSIQDFNIEAIVESIFHAASSVGGRDKDLSRLVANEVVFLINRSISEGDTPTTEEINDFIEKTLIERGHARTAKAFILERARKKTYDEFQKKAQFIGTIPYQKIWNVFVWNHQYGYETLANVNKIMNADLQQWEKFVNRCDSAYQQDVRAAANRILAKKDVKLVIIAGPSSSGKTTTTIKLEEVLQEHGKSFKTINVDNYFFDLELHPKDIYGDYDFETPFAIDIQLFNDQLRDLIRGKEVLTPYYDFKNGKRIDDQIPIHLEENEIILLDCLHGLFPDLTKSISEAQKTKIFIETLAQQRDSTGYFVRWTDLRLLRRMIRDLNFRGYKPEQTLTHWHYVRRSEMQYIIPHINTADIDYIINGALAYELPVHKHFLFDFFPEWVTKYKDNMDRTDAFIRAERVYNLMQEVTSATEEQIDAIPKNSLMREYIGGSIYKY